MTKTKSTKRALLMSALALLMCVSMLIGSTFAWFTDSVTSSGNIIKSGTLDVTMEWKDATTTGAQQTYKDASAGAIFNYDLWEPGYVEAKNIKISNVGTLALKYNLNIAANGEVSELADVIDVYFAEGEHTLANREMTELTKVGTLSDILAGMPANMAGDLEANTADTVTIALKMQENAGNKYQGLSIGSDFSVQLLATQLTAEFDSFDNQYDKGAAWDGVVPAAMPATLVVDGDTQTVHVKDAAAFAYLSTLSAKWAELYSDGNGTTYTNYANGAGANYYYSGDWTVRLEADINLMNHPIAPVEIMFGQNTGATAFDGNGYTIRNVNTTTGLFKDGTRASFSNLTLENVKATNGALAGIVNHPVTDVTVKNANISGVDYVGGLVGKTYSSVTGCKVSDSSIVATGKEAGGLIGYAEANSMGSTITNNVVKNVTVYANNRAAGLVAQPNTTVKVYNNTVDTVTVVATDTSEYQPGAVVSNALAPANVYDNTANNCKVGREVYGLTLIPDGENSQIIVNDKEGFLNLTKLFANWTELFTDGNGTTYTNYANGAGADYYYAGRWTVSLEADIDLNNATISPVVIKHPVSTGAPSFEGNNHTIKNAKIVTNATTENEAGLFNASSIAFKNLKLDNIHVTGSNVGNSTAGILSGSVNKDQGVQNITIANSSVTGGKYTGGVVGYGYTDVLNCTLTNVTVKGGYKLGGLIGYICTSGTNTGDVSGNTLTDCTVDGIGGGVYAGGKDKYIIGKLVGNYNCNGTCNNNTITNMTTSATANIGEIEAGKTVTQ